jgi:hypothetical protein
LTTNIKRRHRTHAAFRAAGRSVEPADETKHFKMIGTTGTGKSTAIRELLEGALERGDRAVIADPDGSYLNRFYDSTRGDVILNPFDPRDARASHHQPRCRHLHGYLKFASQPEWRRVKLVAPT